MSSFKTQLKDALTSAVSYFQDTGDPNAAAVKAANEAGFGEDQADRLVETFNTARVICHYKAAADKTSPCSLADKETVRAGLVAPVEKAAEYVYDGADYDCYRQAEVDYVVPAVKMAEFTVFEAPLSQEMQDWMAVRRFETVRECVKTAEEEARAAYSMADSLAEKIAGGLSRNPSLDDVHDRVARIVAAYAMDDRYAPGVEKVAEFLPALSDPPPAVLHKYAAMHVIDVDDLSDVMEAIKEASDFVAEGAAMEAYAEDMRKQAQAVDVSPLVLPNDKDSLDRLLLKERIMGERARRMSMLLPSRREPSRSGGGGSGGGGSGGGGSGGESYSPTEFMMYLAETARNYHDTGARKRIDEATARVNNLRRKLILEDLLTRDKVLSQEDPEAVVAAFRSVNQLSPDTTLNKEVLRSMLRGAVQSVALSPYDAKTLADVDKTRRQAYNTGYTKARDDEERDNG